MYLTQIQITKLRDKVENNMSADIKLSKAQIKKNKVRRKFKIFFNEAFTKANKTSYFIRKKNVLAPLRLSSAMSATYATIQKRIMVQGG